MMFARTIAAATFFFTTAASAADFKDFRDWHAACDNLRDCVAFGLESDVTGLSYLRLARGGAPDAPVTATIAVDVQDGIRFTLRFDDPSLPGLPEGELTGDKNDDDEYRRIVLTAPADQLIASIRKAGKIVVTRIDPPGGKPSDPQVSEISLSGAVAALLWIDEQQKRLGTTTALIRRGDKPASAVPPQPKVPTIAAAKPAKGPAPANTPAALVAKGRALCDFAGEKDEESRLEEVQPLGGGLFLYSFVCPASSGAYNYNYSFLVAPAGNAKAARTVSFRWPAQVGDLVHDDPEQTALTNPRFDPDTMTLSSFDKGRGLGDCGTYEQWVWDGRTFRLALVKIMPHCKGIPLTDWPVLYRAEGK